VDAPDQFLTYWYFHLPNMILAAAIYTLIGRYLLSLFFRGKEDRAIIRAFASITDPILKTVAAITPKIVPPGLILVFAIIWLMALRMALFLGLALAGLRPGIGG
jgi:YggT family protein